MHERYGRAAGPRGRSVSSRSGRWGPRSGARARRAAPEPQPNGTVRGSCPRRRVSVRFAPTHQTRCWRSPAVPQTRTLYEPSTEHDSCGFGFVADISGRASHAIVRDALTVLVNLEHRGASGSEANTGDGAGLLRRDPHRFLGRRSPPRAASSSRPAATAWRWCSCRATSPSREGARERFEQRLAAEGLELLGWRDVPTDTRRPRPLRRARASPSSRQAFIARPRRPPRTRTATSLRPPPLRRPPAGREGRRPERAPGPRRLLRPLDVLPHDRLQGDAQRAASC